MAKLAEVNVPGPSAKRPPEVQAFLEALRSSRGPNAYVVLLGMKTYETAKLHQKIEKGIEYRYLEKLHSLMDLQLRTLTNVLLISGRTVHRRKAAGRLQPDESDRMLRLTRLYGKAIQLFEGDNIDAMRWLQSPAKALGGETPLNMSKTEPGALEVERLIGRLEHGVFA